MRIRPIVPANTEKHIQRVFPVVRNFNNKQIHSFAEETVVKKTGFPLILGKIQNGITKIKNLFNRVFRKNNANISSYDSTIEKRHMVIPSIHCIGKVGKLDVNIQIQPRQVAGQFKTGNGTKVNYVSPNQNITIVNVENAAEGLNYSARLRGGPQGTTEDEILCLNDTVKHILKEQENGTLKSNIDVAKLF